MSAQRCLERLSRGPATAQQLAEFCCSHAGGIARDMAKLIKDGRAVRIDGGSGRGSKAIYALRKGAVSQAKPRKVNAAIVDTRDTCRRSSYASQTAELVRRYTALAERVRAERSAA